jgi:hypothetical protein
MLATTDKFLVQLQSHHQYLGRDHQGRISRLKAALQK